MITQQNEKQNKLIYDRMYQIIMDVTEYLLALATA